MDIEFLKTLYFRELDRRVQLDSAPTPRVAILGIVGGVFTYHTDRLTLTDEWATLLFLSSAASAVIFSTLSVVWIIRSYVGYTWAYLPFADQLANHYETLVEYHEAYASETAEPERLFENHLRQRLVEATTQNASNNNQRSELIYRASLFLSVAVVFALLAGVPLLSNRSPKCSDRREAKCLNPKPLPRQSRRRRLLLRLRMFR
jgi:hypothetical protein